MIEEGLHYHLGYKYTGMYKNGLEDGLWTISDTIRETIEPIDILICTTEFKEGFQDGEMKLFNEENDIIYFGKYEKGEELKTDDRLFNVKECMRVLDPLGKKYSDVWKVRDAVYENDGISKGEGYLLENVDKE